VTGGSVVQVDWDRKVVVRDGTDFPFDPREYWILAPAATTWDEECGVVRPLDFGFMLHNARTGKGILPPLATLTQHFTSRSLKGGNARLAEELIEKRRAAKFPGKPSRLDSYFLNTHREVAERRAASWNWQNRKLVRCHLLTTTESSAPSFIRVPAIALHHRGRRVHVKVPLAPDGASLMIRHSSPPCCPPNTKLTCAELAQPMREPRFAASS